MGKGLYLYKCTHIQCKRTGIVASCSLLCEITKRGLVMEVASITNDKIKRKKKKCGCGKRRRKTEKK